MNTVRDIIRPDGSVRHNVGSDNLSDEDREAMQLTKDQIDALNTDMDTNADVRHLEDSYKKLLEFYPRKASAAGISSLTLAVIGREHFGNPIPKGWFPAARALIAEIEKNNLKE